MIRTMTPSPDLLAMSARYLRSMSPKPALRNACGVTPHSFRRTAATVLDRASGADLAAEMLGHTSSKITKQHYIEPDEKVNPVTAEILESLAPRKPEESRWPAAKMSDIPFPIYKGKGMIGRRGRSMSN